MDKRLAKRHKRQVTRERERVKLSEPDLRTPEQIQAARDASRANTGHSKGASLQGSALPGRAAPPTRGGSRTDGGE